MTNPDISIMVCTYNRAGMLRDALRSLYDLQTAGEFTYEVLVVDNNSSDDTPAAIAAAATESTSTLRCVRETKPGVAAARNRGVREARGEWIAFFDDDQIADPNWLLELRRGASEHNSRVVGGAVHLLLPENCTRDLHPFCRMLLGESRWSETPQPYDDHINPGAGNLLVEKSVFAEVGVFNEALRRGEDTDLYRRTRAAGMAAWYLPKAIIHHMTPDLRLEDAYLHKLSRSMGEGVNDYEWNDRGPLVATAIWLAKAARAVGLYWPKLQWACVTGNHEAAVGLRCQLVLSAGHFWQGWARLRQRLSGPRTKVPTTAVASRPLA
ncbi:Putative glycosyltransferase EpsH [Anatilimnocola aggregata]|uniref:Glycosyltransferase EpsH n=1 Tax=Anatilimnocola aggregata TaxID=2528021 RepID=A0A517YAU0_9BACT|nr:glycosyltransferase [Anatilimnocola aggregata]QDU27339.1 Putative glycosyltransferase EpsH [Anatilimnocola aggregata]